MMNAKNQDSKNKHKCMKKGAGINMNQTMQGRTNNGNNKMQDKRLKETGI